MVQQGGGRSACEGAGDEERAGWPPSFPHREIDALIDRLERGGAADRTEAHRLLGLVSGEAQRLRSTVVRLVTARLSEADREAQRIVAAAIQESEQLLAAARESIRVQTRAGASVRAEQPGSREPIRAVPDQSAGPAH
ncbi:hypothetical protein [Nocardioides sp. L-11A]|uniref:hypothetical protein n=1 Tax=Nocardioides sp. L-11A TaxID=3043848 RepID=UPI00249AFDA1|nr:hypothetical protein QJ852_18930 [Nocardioides sp. L-11A]